MTLADRVEMAGGPDRSIDVEIFRAVGAPVPFQFANKMVALTYDEADRCYYATVGDMRVRYEPPGYSASLDAAMSLVPEAWAVAEMKDGIRHEGGAYCHVRLWCPMNSALGYKYPANAATPALALCAAAIRARATLGDAS